MAVRLTLTTRILLGFSVLVICAGIVGFTGWRGTARVKTVVALSSLGDDCLADLATSGYMRRDLMALPIDQNSDKDKLSDIGTKAKELIEKWRANNDALLSQLKQLAGDPNLSEDGKKSASEAKSNMELYMASLDKLIAARAERDAAFQAFGKTGWSITDVIGSAKDKIIKPAFESAQSAKDSEQMVRWHEASEGLEARIVEPFLLLRIRAIYYGGFRTDDTWKI